MRIRPRAFPYPYRGMLAISNDVDHTSVRAFREIHRFLHTHEMTSMGPGIGLDIADSMWFYKRHGNTVTLPTAQTSYFLADDWSQRAPTSDELLEYVRAGWIDTIHSYGDFSQARTTGRLFTREHALRAIEVCEENAIRLPVWVNHGNRFNRQNLGDSPQMEGDNVESPAYHADLLPNLGVRFLSLSHTSEDTMDDVITPYVLRDGSALWGFRRSACVDGVPKPAERARRFGVPVSNKGGRPGLFVWHPRALHLQITQERLELLASENAAAIYAQHLGSIRPMNRLGRLTVDALRVLQRYHEDGRVLVTRSSRLLDYHRVRDHLQVRVDGRSDSVVIDVQGVDDPVLGWFVPRAEDLRGITFYAPDPTRVQLMIEGRPIDEALVSSNPNDGVAPSIGIRWHSFDRTDYSAPFSREPGVLVGPVSVGSRPLRAAVDFCRQIGFVDGGAGARILCLEAPGGLNSVGLAASNQHGVAVITDNEACADPHGELRPLVDDLPPGSRLLIEQPAAGVPAVSKPVSSVVAMNLASRGDLERVVRDLARVMGSRGKLYLVNEGLGGVYQELLINVGGRRWDVVDRLVSKVIDATLYRAGFGTVPAEHRVRDFEDVVRIVDYSGFRYLDEPGALGDTREVSGFEGDRDLLVRRLATNEGKKYRRELPVDELIEGMSREADGHDQLRSLVRSGLARLVLEVLEGSGGGPDDPDWAMTFVLATMKSGHHGKDAEVSELWVRCTRSLQQGDPVRSMVAGYEALAAGETARAHEALMALPADHPARAVVGPPSLEEVVSAEKPGDPYWLGQLAAALRATMVDDPDRVHAAMTPLGPADRGPDDR